MLRQVTNQAIRTLATRVETPRGPQNFGGYGGSQVNPAKPEATMDRASLRQEKGKDAYQNDQTSGMMKETKASEDRARGVDMNEMKHDAREAAQEGKQKAGEAKEQVKEKYQEAKEDVKEAYHESGTRGVVETAKEKAHDAKEMVQEKMHEAKEKTEKVVDKAKEWVKDNITGH